MIRHFRDIVAYKTFIFSISFFVITRVFHDKDIIRRKKGLCVNAKSSDLKIVKKKLKYADILNQNSLNK